MTDENPTPMTVAQLIAYLRTFDPSLPVIYHCCSEYTLLQAESIRVARLQPARPDGWVHDSFGTRHLRSVDYLVFPGN